jgi:circadian clock protein KaiB
VHGEEAVNQVPGRQSDTTVEGAAEATGAEPYILRLYVSGMTPRAGRAIESVRAICHEYLEGRYMLEVIDIYQQPVLARDQQIVAAPTLIKERPLPARRIIGDMSNSDRLLSGLDLVRS